MPLRIPTNDAAWFDKSWKPGEIEEVKASQQ
jgi:hypothetical protein